MSDSADQSPPAAPDTFKIALPVCVMAGLWGILAPDHLASVAGSITRNTIRAVDWFFLLSMTAFVVLMLYFGFGRYGKLKLGREGDEPEFSTPSWIAMLFAAGMGVGLLFWGAAEPVLHFTKAPGVVGRSAEAAGNAMVVTTFHWGLHAWACYGLAALVLAFFGFRKGLPYLPGAPLRSVFRGRWVNPTAFSADLIAVLAVAFGVAGSLAMGIFQLQAGLHVVTGASNDSPWVAVGILVVLVAAYMTSAGTGLDKGIKWLSNINMWLAIALLAAVFLAGETAHLMGTFTSAVGDYLSKLVGLSFQTYPHGRAADGWLETWTLTSFIWWIAWAPFVGVFIARISRGRTLREFVTGVLIVPTAFSLLWFAVFGGTALYEEMHGAGGIADLINQDITVALFSLFDRLPASSLLSTIAMVLDFVFLVTSADSATYVLGMLTSNGAYEPPVRRKISWGVTIGAMGAALMLSKNIHAVRSMSVLGALPFTLVMLLQAGALLRSIRREPTR